MPDEVANSDELSLDALESPRYVDPAVKAAARERVVFKLRLLWNRRQFTYRLTGAGLVLSAVIAYLIPNRYESTIRLMPPDQSNSGIALLAAAATGGRDSSAPGTSLGGSGLGAIAGDLLGLRGSGELFIGILQSRTVEDQLINKFDLRKVYSDKYFEDAREHLEKKTSVSEDRKSGIISVTVTDKNPNQAAAMAQEFVDELNRLVARVNTSSAHREREFLEERLTQVKQDLANAERGFSEFASKNTAIDIPAQGKAMIEAAAALEGQFILAKTELEGMRQIYTDENLRVRSIQARVDELQKQLEKLGGSADTSAKVDLTDNQLVYPPIRKLPLLGVSYADLYRNTKIQEAIFETLTQEYELAKVQEVKETPSVKVLDSPNVPERKSFPSRVLIILLGTLLAFVAGITCVLGKTAWEATDAGDPRKALAQEVLSRVRTNIPWASQNGSSVQNWVGRSWNRLHRPKDENGESK